MYRLPDNSTTASLAAGVVIDEVFYPWPISEEKLAELGITWEADPVRADDRFYWNGDLNTPRPLADVAAMFWNERIQPKRDALQVAGCKVGADWFHNDVKSRTQWERMANKANASGMLDADNYLIGGQPVPWKTMAGSFVVLTAGKIREVVDAFEVREATLFSVAEQHKAAISALPTVEDMIAYDWNTGWPQSYEEFLAEQAQP